MRDLDLAGFVANEADSTAGTQEFHRSSENILMDNDASRAKALLFYFILKSLRKLGMSPADIAEMFNEDRVKTAFELIDSKES